MQGQIDGRKGNYQERVFTSDNKDTMTSLLCCPSLFPVQVLDICAANTLNSPLPVYCVYISMSYTESFLSIKVVSSTGKRVLLRPHSPFPRVCTRVCMVTLLDSLGPDHELWQPLCARICHPAS